MREDEAKKLVADRKREKAEEEKARARVKAQIEADKAARRAKLAGVPPSEAPPTSPPATADTPKTAATGPAKTYTETKLQV